jgi:ABC-2 type transport system permease protein
MFRIPIQSFLPSIIINLLYFSIFGTVMGPRIGLIDGVEYSLFIAPGLVLIAVITNSYSNTSSSLFSMRFQRSIEEILVSPINPALILLGYTLGGVIRGVITATLVLLVSCLFITLDIKHLPFTYLVIILISTTFSLAGFTNGMLAKTFDDVMLVPTFILSPLTYLGGVFYSIDMLPPLWHKIVWLNPIFYMVDLLRYAMTHYQNRHWGGSMTILCLLIITLAIFNFVLLKRGVGMRD